MDEPLILPGRRKRTDGRIKVSADCPRLRPFPAALPCYFSRGTDVTGVPLGLAGDDLDRLGEMDAAGKLCIVEFFSGASIAMETANWSSISLKVSVSITARMRPAGSASFARRTAGAMSGNTVFPEITERSPLFLTRR